MEHRALERTDLEVSTIGLGTWAMGGEADVWGTVDDRESIAAIHRALDLGVNLIDTAPIYGLGHSEIIVGKAIRERRSEVVLATKCGLLPPPSKGTLPRRCLKPESIVRECEQSLRRLHTETIDLYQCHWPDPDTPLRETMTALTDLLKQGKIRAIGLSNFGCEKLAAACEFGPVHALQPPFSMVQPRAANDLLPFCAERGIAVLPYSPLAKGLLTGKFSEDDTFHGIREKDPDFMGRRFRRNLQLVEALKSIAGRYDKTLAQLVINWTATFPAVTSVLVGAKRQSQVVENVGAVGWTITPDDRTGIDELVRGNAGDA